MADLRSNGLAPTQRCQVPQDSVLGDAVAKVLLFRVTAQVVDRQHRYWGPSGQRRVRQRRKWRPRTNPFASTWLHSLGGFA
jgi:hypothetical protein